MNLQAIKYLAVVGLFGMYSWFIYGWGASSTQMANDLTATKHEVVQLDLVVKEQVTVRQEETRRSDVIEKVETDNAAAQVQQAAALAESDATGDRLFAELALLRKRYASSQASCNARIDQQFKARASAIDLLTELYEGAERRANGFAAEADRARQAGLNCESSYDGVRGK